MTEFFEYFEKVLRTKNSSNAEASKNLVDRHASKRPAFPPPPPPFDVNNNYVGQANRNLKFKSKGPATPLTRSITTNTFAVEQKKEKSILRTFDLISWLRNKRSNPSKQENMTKSMHDLPGLSTFDAKNLY